MAEQKGKNEKVSAKKATSTTQTFVFCPRCGHTITGDTLSPICPECGYRFCPSCGD